ncbi:hypothetical protein SBA5_650028 [Candidatus Sulfotelmatomonas gaucii]|uniref:Uncharacterized protein n=1 Tax=Candidatus Sulfuritelmatomonas gaucii TaxID=2043161 RepID=A0A2N9LYS6_9BACT|nr:hypothetical protein SBA5_650028 [Candidatus Sulfotelmatomonas gaucii]
MISEFFGSAWDAVRDINRRYKRPHIKMTPAVLFSLGLLRFYLLFLVGLLVWKFFSVLHK